MALTTTYSTGALTANAKTIVLAAFTSPTVSGAVSPKTILRFATGEYCLVTAVNGTSVDVVRGYAGSMAVAHVAYEGVQYGLTSDTAWPAAPATVVQVAPVSITNAQLVTLTGSTGTDAAVVTAPWPAFLDCTGASGAGVNLPYPAVGAMYTVKNSTTGTMKIYCVGGSLNGTTGTTAVSLTSTGVDGSIFWCAVAGAWQGAPNSV